MSVFGMMFRALRRFASDRRGNVAVIYALAIIPLFIAAGGALDYARTVVVRTRLAEALDAAALAVGGSSGLTTTQMQTLAQQYFDANYHVNSSYGTPAALTMTVSGQSIVLSTTDSVPTTVLKVAGIDNLDVAVSNKVVWGQLKLWVSLVLDSTGSMSQTDSTGLSKISALKTASHQLLTMLQGASTTPGDVKVAIVPFVKDINVGKSNYNAWWIDWTDWDANNGSCSTDRRSTTQSTCIVAHCSRSWYTTESTCVDYYGTWYPAGVWTPANHDTWNGCIMDRGQTSAPYDDYDVTNASPVSGTAASLFPAEQYSQCSGYSPTLAPVLGLSDDWSALSDEIDALVAGGGTNQTIGLAWGWQSLTDGEPMEAGTLPSGTGRYIIILSDGYNTQDRWYGNGFNHSTQVDDRMTAVCTNAKADGIVVYAVLVDIDGTQSNASVLQSCASDPSKYFDLTSSSQIVTAFNTIGQQITNLRVAQ